MCSISTVTSTILSRLPAMVSQGHVWEMSVSEIEMTLDRQGCRGVIYDVLHVLEGLGIVTKLTFADRFQWNGINYLITILTLLRDIGLSESVPKTMEAVRELEIQGKLELFDFLAQDNVNNNQDDLGPEGEERARGHDVGKKVRLLPDGLRTTANLTQYFVMILLHARGNHPVSLRFAAQVMLSLKVKVTANFGKKEVKALMRRLYAVANVLLALDRVQTLVKKVRVSHVGAVTSNAFCYLGPEPVTSTLTPEVIRGLPGAGAGVFKPLIRFHRESARGQGQSGDEDLVEIRKVNAGEGLKVDLTF